MVVGLGEIVEHDKTVLDVADLPPGWVATRTGVGANWIRMPQYADVTRVVVDWSKINSTDEFFDTVFAQCGAPDWHGKNLNALADSWITGSINEYDPPYLFVFDSLGQTPSNLVQFRDSVLQIAQQSIDENGGRLQMTDEQSVTPKPDLPHL
ncbi:barstar family protein [Altericista sp. CCNU0014]|uniref:barstar family protein n=1 Tax=Altericista sp. CCNU0014 TaxID=3082949 RepID=UPI00384AEAD3